MKFKKSIILNVIGYRRYGHNESDDPSYTQPSLYNTIKSHKPVHEILEKEINITENFKNDIENKICEKLKSEYEKSKKQNFKKEFSKRTYKNKISSKTNDDLNNKFVIQYLKSFEKIDLHSKIKKQYADKRQKFAKDKKLDWATAESLAFFNILKHKNIRMSGQDSFRGTFSHRHAKPVNAKVEYENIILKVSNDMGHKNNFRIQNTLLSEYAAMGFEYGYSLYNPDQNYVIWEAQFGDFANGAQIIIDQYIASSYYKWSDISNIALLLPHGYEGQGPEHSSGRIERFLQLCANHNMYVCCPSDSINYAAMLYFHAILSIKCPMVIFTPKSLLRSSDSFGIISDMKNGFQKIIYDKKAIKVKNIIFCTGKIYYEIKDIIEKKSLIVRIEQLFPFPKEDIKQILNKHKKANLIWIQEEPKNMGAYIHIKNNLEGIDLKYIGRDEMAVTAGGLLKSHKKEQERIISRVKKL